MRFRIILLPRAEQDIQAAARWIWDQSRSFRTTTAWIDRIRAKIQTLESNPRRCPLDLDIEGSTTEVRTLTYGPMPGRYRILFRIVEDCVEILTVRHAARGYEEIDPDE